MKTIPTVEGKFYCVATSTNCDVTTEAGTLLGTAVAGQPLWFQAQKGNTTTLSDDNAEYSASRFNSAPQQQLAVLGVLGGDMLPAGYTNLPYLESTGTQYIGTGIALDNTVDAALKVDVLAGSTLVPEEAALSGNFADTGKALTLTWSDGSTQRLNLRFGNNVIRLVNDASITYAEKGLPHVFRNNSTGYFVDGELRWAWQDSAIWSTANTFLYMVSGTDFSSNYNARNARWYALIIKKKGKLTVVFTPCLDETGAPCMFDLVTKKPFYNSGTGDFLYPGQETETTTYSLRPRMYAQKTEHGIRRLYRVPAGYNGGKEEYAEEKGFKILVETPMPEEGYWTPVWHDREDCIELEWVETEHPMEETLNEAE